MKIRPLLCVVATLTATSAALAADAVAPAKAASGPVTTHVKGPMAEEKVVPKEQVVPKTKAGSDHEKIIKGTVPTPNPPQPKEVKKTGKEKHKKKKLTKPVKPAE
jgi:hypothetical protein